MSVSELSPQTKSGLLYLMLERKEEIKQKKKKNSKEKKEMGSVKLGLFCSNLYTTVSTSVDIRQATHLTSFTIKWDGSQYPFF